MFFPTSTSRLFLLTATCLTSPPSPWLLAGRAVAASAPPRGRARGCPAAATTAFAVAAAFFSATPLDQKAPDQCPRQMSKARRMSDWRFAPPSLATSLPLDPEKRNFGRHYVPKSVFSHCQPTPLRTERKLVAVSDDALRDLLDMDPSIGEDPDFVDFVSGNHVLDGSVPLSHRYGGYQFGSWAGQLGDGRAHLLGEYVNQSGERWELQLKGSGETPYSRFGDGRAVLRSSVREFLCSEAMFRLGVPTSRAAAIVVSDDPVKRDMFYDGRMKQERAAVVLRLAPSWFRIGSLEILAVMRERQEMTQLLEFVLKTNFPHIVRQHQEKGDDQASLDDQCLSLLSEVTERTAYMIACWQSVGFTHGVMNTDNLSLLSITIDYGPFGFVDEYDPNFVPNSSDDWGRYDLESQPTMALWNLRKLGEALKTIVKAEKHPQITTILNQYESIYQAHFLKLFRAKLGLPPPPVATEAAEVAEADKEDMRLFAILLDLMQRKYADFTQSLRDLSELSLEDLREGKISRESNWGLHRLRVDKDFQMFLDKYADRLQKYGDWSDEQRMSLMQKSNPRYVLRNWMAQGAIERAEKDDFSEVQRLLRVLKRPFDIQVEAERAGYARPPPSWSKTLRVSCSS